MRNSTFSGQRKTRKQRETATPLSFTMLLLKEIGKIELLICIILMEPTPPPLSS
jgi:hypothetical protein